MATRKRNEWLDAEESEEDVGGYDSEEESRAKLLRTSKRQKVSHSASEDEDDQDLPSDSNSTCRPGTADQHLAAQSQLLTEAHSQLASDDEDSIVDISQARPPQRPLDISKLSKPKKDKSGIIYLSRVPPFMKPSVLRTLLTPYGTVSRIFLTPEPTTSRSARLKSGGSRRKLFLDGWVEFASKRDAKFVATNLNAQTMGGNKRGRWYEEVWNVRYLRGVKWEHLVEQVRNENAERQARLRHEISQSKVENRRFLEDVERGQIGRTMEGRRAARGGGEVGDEGGEEGDTGVAGGAADDVQPTKKGKGRRREFKQNEIKIKAQKKPEAGQDVGKVLGMMF